MIISFIMILLSRLSLFIRRLARRVKRLLCPIAQTRRYDEKEDLMEAGLLEHKDTLHTDITNGSRKSGYAGKETRMPSIQMSPIEVMRKSSHKPANQSSLVESTQMDVLVDASAIKDSIRYLLASKYGIDRQKLAVIIRMQREHEENELEGPVLIDPVKLL